MSDTRNESLQETSNVRVFFILLISEIITLNL